MAETLNTTPLQELEEQKLPAGTWRPESFDAERIHQLVGDLIPSDEVRNGRNYGVHVIEGDDPHSDVGRFVEWQVFEERFGNDLDTMREEYTPYDQASTFLMVLDYENEKPVGVIRLIRPSEAGFKSLNDLVNPSTSPWYKEGDTIEKRIAEAGNDPEHTIDIGTMAVMPEYKSGHAETGASASLYSSCVRWSLATGHNNWVTIVHKKIYEMMQSWGEPFTPFEGTGFKDYLGADSIPVHAELYSGLERIKKFDEEMSAKTGQAMDIHGLYTRGAGLEQGFVLPNFPDTVQ